MTKHTKAVLLRAARSAAAVAVAALAGWLAGPDVTSIVGSTGALVISGVAIPALLTLDKWLRGPDGAEY